MATSQPAPPERPGGGFSPWMWGVTAGLALVIVVVVIVVVAAGGDDDGDAAGTTTTTAASTTTAGATTTTAGATTTTAGATTTTAAVTTTTEAGALVPATPVVGVLGSDHPTFGSLVYGDGADLFAPGSVEAHWYQANGFYVVLYRGLDLDATGPLCPGNSILTDAGFTSVSNTPVPPGTPVDDVCDFGPDLEVSLAAPPAGAFICDGLVYYLTEIEVTGEGTLFGTVEVGDGTQSNGQTSVAPASATVPEFEPGLAVYDLPAADVEDARLAVCGS